MVRKGNDWYKQKDMADKYDSYRFDRGGKVLDFKEKEMLLSLIKPEGKLILDIATGTGRFAELLESEGGKVIGLDASREMLTPGKAEYLIGDALSLPFSDNVFDITISMRFIHLLKPDQIDGFIEEVARVTKDKFVFETLHPLSLRLLYQWMLPQNSHMYSNSFLKEKFETLPSIKKAEYHETFAIPYGIYQILPLNLAEELSKLDEKMVEEYDWLASTVYWELYFE